MKFELKTKKYLEYEVDFGTSELNIEEYITFTTNKESIKYKDVYIKEIHEDSIVIVLNDNSNTKVMLKDIDEHSLEHE